tara:strand:- start:21793 stop:22497 length:705 start_codon:yes stop_codon:yes gene_type:complete
MITLKHDQWKRDRFNKSLEENLLKFDYTTWEGVLAKEQPKIVNWAIRKGYTLKEKSDKGMGNLGAGLAHLTLLNHIAHQPEGELFLVLEDNASANSNTKEAVPFAKMYYERTRFDFLNLCVLRPKGTCMESDSDFAGVLKVQKEKDWSGQNVWMSSFVITPVGARKILRRFRERPVNLNRNVIDRVVSRILSENDDINAFVLARKQYFNHHETNNDTRKKLNGAAAPIHREPGF